MAHTCWPATTRGLNLYDENENLRRALKRAAPDLLARREADLRSLGAFAGGKLDAVADYSDRIHPPVLTRELTDPVHPGTRRGRVHLNDRYLDCQQETYKRGFLATVLDPVKPEPHLYAFLAQMIGADVPWGCPFAMTHPDAIAIARYAPACAPEIRPAVQALLQELLRTDGQTKTGATWVTESHSGSDAGNTATEAVPQADGTHRLYGVKWFTSNAGAGIALTLARIKGQGDGARGLGLYLVPSHIDQDWQIENEYEVTHLKEKLGTRALATGEIRLDGALAYELVPPPQGLKAMMEVLGCSRVHNAMAAAGTMHRALMEVMCWAEHRKPFGKPLLERPMIQKSIIDMNAEWMAGSAMAIEAAISFDQAVSGSEDDRIWMRIVTALAKYKTAVQAESVTNAAKNIFAAAGYVEDYPVTRINRDAQVLTVWEGPKNVQALELMRMICRREPGDAVFMKRLRAIAQGLPDDPMIVDKSNLDMRLLYLENALEQLRARTGDDDNTADQVADEFLDIMSDVLSYALLLHEAAWEMTNEQDMKKLLVARRYYDLTFERKLIPGFQPSVLQAQFEKLSRGLPIPRESVTALQGLDDSFFAVGLTI